MEKAWKFMTRSHLIIDSCSGFLLYHLSYFAVLRHPPLPQPSKLDLAVQHINRIWSPTTPHHISNMLPSSVLFVSASQDPHRWICSLMIFSFDETFVATGFLVKGLKTIFTTAHSLSGAEMVEIKFPGLLATLYFIPYVFYFSSAPSHP